MNRSPNAALNERVTFQQPKARDPNEPDYGETYEGWQDVFVEGKLLGKRSDIEGVWLSRAMENAEYANRLRLVSAFIEGKLSLDGAQQMATKVVERYSQADAANDPSLKPSETYGIDIERINKEVNAFAARQAERERCFHERIDRIIQSKKWTHDNSACTASQTGIAIRIDNAASYAAKLCERLAAANTNDHGAVSAYERLKQNSPEKLQCATWSVMPSIGYGFAPSTPDDVFRSVVERVRAF